MKVLTFSGEFGWSPNEKHEGFICFVCLQPKDKLEKLDKIARSLAEESKGNKIILVPFAHLDSNPMEEAKAQSFFLSFSEIMKKHEENISVAPFGVEK